MAGGGIHRCGTLASRGTLVVGEGMWSRHSVSLRPSATKSTRAAADASVRLSALMFISVFFSGATISRRGVRKGDEEGFLVLSSVLVLMRRK